MTLFAEATAAITTAQPIESSTGTEWVSFVLSQGPTVAILVWYLWFTTTKALPSILEKFTEEAARQRMHDEKRAAQQREYDEKRADAMFTALQRMRDEAHVIATSLVDDRKRFGDELDRLSKAINRIANHEDARTKADEQKPDA